MPGREGEGRHSPAPAAQSGQDLSRDAREGKGPRPQRLLGRRLEEVVKAVGGVTVGYTWHLLAPGPRIARAPLRQAAGVQGGPAHLAATIMTSKRMPGLAMGASAQARAGLHSGSTHSHHTLFMAAKSFMSLIQIVALSTRCLLLLGRRDSGGCGVGRGGVGWEPGTGPDRPYASVACAAGCPTLDWERLEPPQTQCETGAVKFPAHTLTHTHTRQEP